MTISAAHPVYTLAQQAIPVASADGKHKLPIQQGYATGTLTVEIYNQRTDQGAPAGIPLTNYGVECWDECGHMVTAHCTGTLGLPLLRRTHGLLPPSARCNWRVGAARPTPSLPAAYPAPLLHSTLSPCAHAFQPANLRPISGNASPPGARCTQGGRCDFCGSMGSCCRDGYGGVGCPVLGWHVDRRAAAGSCGDWRHW